MTSEIKNTISLLCKLLNVVYENNLKPEHFRLAKFNKTDEQTVPILWNTLCIILDVNNIISVQGKLRSLNYTRAEFYTLNEEHNNESRELLLALAFLISVKIESDIQEKVGKNLLVDIYEQSDGSQVISEHDKFNWKSLPKHDLEHYKKWLCGKISSNNNMLFEYREQINKIQEKYNKSLDVKAHSELTIYEILALKNKKVGEQFIQDTERVVHLMTVYIEWTKKEKQFWKWMITVLEEAKKIS